MKYEPTIKNNILIIVISITLYIFSPSQVIPVYTQTVQAKEIETTTGEVERNVHVPLQDGGKENTEKYTYEKQGKNDDRRDYSKKMECDATCKVETLVSLGIEPKIAGSLVYTCKNTSENPVRCIKLGASIAMAESGGGNRCYKNGCFGILAGGISYTSLEDGVEDWVERYNKWWFKQENPSSFYSNSPNWKPKTRYCMSEVKQDGTSIPYCKNGFSHSWSMFNKLDKLF